MKTEMNDHVSRSWRYGHLLSALAGLVGAILAGYAYFTPGSGVDNSGGALLVIVSSILILLASLLLALVAGVPRWLRGLFLVLLFVGIVCTAIAGYFLELDVLVGMMVVALIGWIIAMTGTPASTPRPAIQ